MKHRLLRLLKLAVAPVALIAAAAVLSPVSALAAEHGRGGFGGGHGGYSGGHAYSAPARGFRGGGEFRGGRENFGGRGYYRPGFGFGVGVYAPYGYAAPACNPAGFYDQYGNWQYYPGCAVPYGY
jgi:hypothetical protein